MLAAILLDALTSSLAGIAAQLAQAPSHTTTTAMPTEWKRVSSFSEAIAISKLFYGDDMASSSSIDPSQLVQECVPCGLARMLSYKEVTDLWNAARNDPVDAWRNENIGELQALRISIEANQPLMVRAVELLARLTGYELVWYETRIEQPSQAAIKKCLEALSDQRRKESWDEEQQVGKNTAAIETASRLCNSESMLLLYLRYEGSGGRCVNLIQLVGARYGEPTLMGLDFRRDSYDGKNCKVVDDLGTASHLVVGIRAGYNRSAELLTKAEAAEQRRWQELVDNELDHPFL